MSRRSAVFAIGGILAAILVLAGTAQRSDAQAPQLTEKYFSSYVRAHRVTIRRNGNVVTTFDIPVGVYLSVYSDQQPVRTAQEGRVEFHGNVEIRTLPRSDVDRNDGNDATQLMARAPLVVAAQNVDVVSETIIP